MVDMMDLGYYDQSSSSSSYSPVECNYDNEINSNSNNGYDLDVYSFFFCLSELQRQLHLQIQTLLTPRQLKLISTSTLEYLIHNCTERQKHVISILINLYRGKSMFIISLILLLLTFSWSFGFFISWKSKTSITSTTSTTLSTTSTEKRNDDDKYITSANANASYERSTSTVVTTTKTESSDDYDEKKNLPINTSSNFLNIIIRKIKFGLSIIINVIQIFGFLLKEKMKALRKIIIKMEENTKSKLPSVPFFTSSLENNLNQHHGIKHIAVIMDGNRRYAKKHHLDPLQGHWEGGKTLTSFVEWCMERNIEMCTAYAFSTENWNRSQIEIDTLMNIICNYGESMTKEAKQKNIRVQVLGTDNEKIPIRVRETLENLELVTKNGTSFTLNLCISYGGQSEICHAVNSILQEQVSSKLQKILQELSIISSPHTATTVMNSNNININKAVPSHISILENTFSYTGKETKDPSLSSSSSSYLNLEHKDSEEGKTIGEENISKNKLKGHLLRHLFERDPSILQIENFEEETFSKYLLTGRKNIPPPDVLLRTSGERRLSNFLLYQIAYTELFFIEKHWPELCSKDLDKIIKEYSLRNRRYGK